MLPTRHRQAEWNLFTSTLNFKDKSLYKLNSRLLIKLPPCQPLKAPDGMKIFGIKPKAELLADTLTARFQNNRGPQLTEVEDSIKNLLDQNIPPSDFFVHPNEVWNIIKCLHPAKDI